MKLWQKLKSVFKKQSSESNDDPIKLWFNVFADDEGNAFILSAWENGKESAYAELLYRLNTGMLLETILESIQSQAREQDKEGQFNEMTRHLYRFFKENSDVELPIVRPSQVFNNLPIDITD